MRVLPYGDTGLLVELADLDEVLGLYRQLVDADLDVVEALVPASRTLLVRIDPRSGDLAAVARHLEEIEPRANVRPVADEVEIPVTYDGEDLAEVGELTGLGSRGVIEVHTSQVWTVGFIGFAPGFAYLTAQDDRLRVPRRPEPRSAVPPGAVGLADEFSGVYPRRSPGGWQLIGRTELVVWDVDRDPPAILAPGGTVRFVEAR